MVCVLKILGWIPSSDKNNVWYAHYKYYIYFIISAEIFDYLHNLLNSFVFTFNYLGHIISYEGGKNIDKLKNFTKEINTDLNQG